MRGCCGQLDHFPGGRTPRPTRKRREHERISFSVCTVRLQALSESLLLHSLISSFEILFIQIVTFFLAREGMEGSGDVAVPRKRTALVGRPVSQYWKKVLPDDDKCYVGKRKETLSGQVCEVVGTS